MATFRVTSWRDIPSQVKVTDDTGATVSKMMPGYIQQEIDRVAMAEGLAVTDDYLEGWTWSDEAEREGSAEAVAEAVAAELADTWQKEHPKA